MPTALEYAHAREAVRHLLNLVEALQQDNGTIRAENEQLQDEINRLKGEQGKPTLKANTAKPAADHSSEQERRQPTDRVKRGKHDSVIVDRAQVLTVDCAVLLAPTPTG